MSLGELPDWLLGQDLDVVEPDLDVVGPALFLVVGDLGARLEGLLSLYLDVEVLKTVHKSVKKCEISQKITHLEADLERDLLMVPAWSLTLFEADLSEGDLQMALPWFLALLETDLDLDLARCPVGR